MSSPLRLKLSSRDPQLRGSMRLRSVSFLGRREEERQRLLEVEGVC